MIIIVIIIIIIILITVNIIIIIIYSFVYNVIWRRSERGSVPVRVEATET